MSGMRTSSRIRAGSWRATAASPPRRLWQKEAVLLLRICRNSPRLLGSSSMINTRGRFMIQLPPDYPDTPPACRSRAGCRTAPGPHRSAHQLSRQVLGLAQRRFNQFQILAHKGLTQSVQAHLLRLTLSQRGADGPGSSGIEVDGLLRPFQRLQEGSHQLTGVSPARWPHSVLH